MTAVKAHQVDQIIRSPKADAKAFLIFGPNEGLVHERANLLAQKLASMQNDGGAVIKLEERDFADQPDRFFVELNTVSMFGGRTVVQAPLNKRLSPDQLANTLAEPLENRLILEAGNLKPTHKVRKLFDKAGDLLSLPCYADDDRALQGIVENMVRDAGKRISPGTRDLLISHLGADRALTRMEMEKLLCYVGENDEVTDADVLAIVGDEDELQYDHLVYDAFDGKTTSAIQDIDRMMAGGQDANAILLAFQRHIRLLLITAASIAEGKPLQASVDALRPPVNFKWKPRFSRQAGIWREEKVLKLSGMTQEAILNARRHPDLSRIYLERLIFSIAAMAKSR